MDRHEQICLCDACLLIAIFQLNEIVAITREHGTHARLLVDQLLEFARHRQSDVLLARAGAAGRAGIHTAMASVDGDDNTTCLRGQRRGALDDIAARIAFWRQLHHEPVTGFIRRWQQETFGMCSCSQIQDNARIALALFAGAQRLEQTPAGSRGEARRKSRTADIQHDAIRIADLEQFVVEWPGNIEHQPGGIGCHRHVQCLNIDRLRRHNAAQQQQGAERSQQRLACRFPHKPAFKRKTPNDFKSFCI